MRRPVLRIAEHRVRGKLSKTSPFVIDGLRVNNKRKRLFFKTRAPAEQELGRIKTKLRQEDALFQKDSALARPLGVSHILGAMREILPGIFTWGSTYADRPWDLNGYAIRVAGCTTLVDPPALGEDEWPSFDVMKPIATIVLTNRDHVRDAELFRTRCGARLVAGADEVRQLAPIAINEAVREGDLIAGALRVIHLPGKSAGEIGLYFDPAYHAVSREMGGILLLGDAIIGDPPGALSLIPEPKLDDPPKLKRSLRKLLDYDFDVLLLCDGQPVLRGGKLKVAEFLNTLT